MSNDNHYFRDHLQEIKSGGWRVFSRKVHSLGLILFRTPFRVSNFLLFKIKRKVAPIVGPVINIYQKERINDILYACYDLSVSPATYDILSFLCSSEIERLKRNCSHIHLLIVNGAENGFKRGDLQSYNRDLPPNAHISISNLQGRLHNIVVPCYQLLPSVQSVSYFGLRNECMVFLNQLSPLTYPENYHVLAPVAGYGFANINRIKDLYKYDVKFEAPAYAHIYVESWIKQRSHGKKVVSITLREGKYSEKRNSLLAEWTRFAEEIIKKGYFPVFVRDTENSPEPPEPTFTNTVTFPEASVHIAIRMALYEQVFLNLAVSGGPFMYCIFTNTPYLLFKLVTECAETTEEHFRRSGFEPGKQPSFCGPYQKWVWKDDTYEVIMEEFLEMIEKLGMESITSA